MPPVNAVRVEPEAAVMYLLRDEKNIPAYLPVACRPLFAGLREDGASIRWSG